MNYSRMVCLDLEMCCWDDGREPRTGEIIEIGLAEIDLKKGEVVQRTQYYVKPEWDEVSSFCTELTGITPRMVNRQGRPLADVLKTVEHKFGAANKIYAAWGRDDQVLLKECQAKGIRYPFREFMNLATLYRMRQRTKARFGHKKAMEIEGLGWEGRHHSGGDDAYNLARLALHIL